MEAALFSAGRPLSIDEIKEATKLDSGRIEGYLNELIEIYNGRESAIEVSKAGEKWGMCVKSEFTDYARTVAKPEVKRKLLETLSLIAYEQPLTQSKLARMLGSKIYDHIKELAELGLIFTIPAGRTKLIKTTEKFSEYFGIPTTDPEKIKEYLSRSSQQKEREKIERMLSEES